VGVAHRRQRTLHSVGDKVDTISIGHATEPDQVVPQPEFHGEHPGGTGRASRR
jgi:hypothetical protein